MTYTDLSKKRILVTGASGIIGGSICEKLSVNGATLVITGRDDQRLTDVFTRLHGTGHEKYIVELTNNEEIAQMIRLSAGAGGFSGFVHCAAAMNLIPLRMLTTKILAYTMAVNFYSFVETVRLITRKNIFDGAGGSIVAVSSITSEYGEAGHGAYSASKAALDAAVRTFAFELAPKKIRINSVRPGVVTDKTGGDNADMENADIIMSDRTNAKKQLLGMGRPEDVANAVTFLLSDESSFITGRYLDVDGGRFL